MVAILENMVQSSFRCQQSIPRSSYPPRQDQRLGRIPFYLLSWLQSPSWKPLKDPYGRLSVVPALHMAQTSSVIKMVALSNSQSTGHPTHTVHSLLRKKL